MNFHKYLHNMKSTITSRRLFFIVGVIFLSIIPLFIFVSGQWKDEQQEDDKCSPNDYFNFVGNRTGGYWQDTKNIVIYTKDREAWSVTRTAMHEICHYVYFEKINESQRDEWELLHNNSVSHHFLNDTEKINLLMNGSSTFVSEYAETNKLEDFAESCSAFVLGWNKLDSRKEIFMKVYIQMLMS